MRRLPPDIVKMKKAGRLFHGNEADKYAPPRKAFCHRCSNNTPTAFVPLSSGHIGNCCSVCRTCRKGKPYATRTEYARYLEAAARQQGDAHYANTSIL